MGNAQPAGRLQLSREQMQELGYRVVDMLVEHFEQLQDQPLTRKADRPTLEERLREPLPEQATAVENVLQQLQQEVLSNIISVAHPRFFAFVPSPSNFVSVMADALASGFNAFAGSWLVSSGPAEIELVTIDWLRQLCGLPSTAGGLFVSGGSVATLTALAAARHVKLRDNMQNAVVYCSDQTHSAIDRALMVLGFAPTQLRKLPSDEDFRLPLSAVEREVAADRAAGKTPFCVIANAGTTNTGAIDPLAALADFCRKEDLWLHADAAYGGAAILCEQGRRLLNGLEQADSLALDPHKWLFQPFEIGCVLVRDNRWLRETFSILPEYLKDASGVEEEVNFRDYGIQLTRSFRALKLWMSLKTFGLQAFRQSIEWGIMLAEQAEEILRRSQSWEIMTPAQLGIITFRYALGDRSAEELEAINQRLVNALISDGFAMISSTTLQGHMALRLCTINPRTSKTDIQETLQRLEHFGNNLSFHLNDPDLL
jgi:aromatic-L-amino-acid/L-tryptophan decarboxylase